MPPRDFSTDFPADDHQSLMNRMDQSVANRFHSCPKLYVQRDSCNHLERFPKWFKGNLGWIMFVADRNDGLSLRAGHLSKLQTITKQTGVPWIGTQKIHGPIFGKFSIVPERPCKLNLKCPVTCEHQIRRAHRFGASSISQDAIRAFGYELDQLRFGAGSDVRLEFLKRRPRRLEPHQRGIDAFKERRLYR